MLSTDIDLTLGGHYRIAFQAWEWESEPGQVTELSVGFRPEGQKTRLTLTHSKLNPVSLHGYKDGWNGTVGKIVEKIIGK